MKWSMQLRRWGSLSLAVAALGGSALAAKRWAEAHALTTVLGAGAHASALQLHWPHSTGCAENISVPLAPADSPHLGTAELTAGRLWFTYDLPSLLRKRLILPRVIIEDAHIQANWAHASTAAGEHSADAVAHGTESVRPAAMEWLQELRERIASLEDEGFVRGRQVAVDAALLNEHWHDHFSNIRERAENVLKEARDIQQQLSALDNVLRHEPQVIASRDRLELLRATLTTIKSDLGRTERTLRDQKSRVREALLIEKTSLQEQGMAFQAPAADQVALKAIELWIAGCLKEPAQTSCLLADMMQTPYRFAPETRGENIRFLKKPLADFAVLSAKMEGEISDGSKSSPFTATGTFQVMPESDVSSDGATPASYARWQMTAGGPNACVSVEVRSRESSGSCSQVSWHSTAPGQIQTNCKFNGESLKGSGRIHMRQLLADDPVCKDVDSDFCHDQLVQSMLEQALGDLTKVPEVVPFRVSGPAHAPRPEVATDQAQWLTDELTRNASARVAEQFDAAAERLEAHIQSELDALNRAVALRHNDALQHVNQLLDQLRVVQSDVLNNLQQRAGTHFARRPVEDAVR